MFSPEPRGPLCNITKLLVNQQKKWELFCIFYRLDSGCIENQVHQNGKNLKWKKEWSTAGNWQTFVVTLKINIISRWTIGCNCFVITEVVKANWPSFQYLILFISILQVIAILRGTEYITFGVMIMLTSGFCIAKKLVKRLHAA